MRTLRKLLAASLSVGRRHLPPSRPTPHAPLCTEAARQLLSHSAIGSAAARATHGGAVCLKACKDRAIPPARCR
jgi:hypothetical protein